MHNDYTILVFDWDDTVAVAQLIRANSPDHAASIARIMSMAYPRLAGYQLWHEGHRVASTFPQSEREPHPPVTAVVQKALKRRAG